MVSNPDLESHLKSGTGQWYDGTIRCKFSRKSLGNQMIIGRGHAAVPGLKFELLESLRQFQN